MSHYEQRLENDLQRIKAEVGKLAQLVEIAVKNSVHALLTGNQELASATILADGHINRSMRKIDGLCHSFIAVHLPSAGPLRVVSSVMRSNILLERVGDYAVTICRESAQLSSPPEGALARGIEAMAAEVRQVLHQAIDAFEAGNTEMARGTMTVAAQVQTTFTALFADLLDVEPSYQLSDRFAVFVVLHRLERIADQAKNLCEEAVFWSTGEAKSQKVYRILFVDEENSCLGPMAQAIARKNYPELGDYSSAGRIAAGALHPGMVQFMDKRGVSLEGTPVALDFTPSELAEFHVIVSLQGSARSYLDNVPFHTVLLDWDVGSEPGQGESALELEETHRKLAVRIRDLMVELRGEDVG